MPIADTVTQSSPGAVVEVTIGGVGRRALTVGGATALPFLSFEGTLPHRPAIAVDIEDRPPDDWAEGLRAVWGEAAADPATWAKAAAAAGADAIALTLSSTHPDGENAPPASAVETVKRVLEATDLPLVVYGPGVASKDNDVLVAVAEATSGSSRRRCGRGRGRPRRSSGSFCPRRRRARAADPTWPRRRRPARRCPLTRRPARRRQAVGRLPRARA